jgi:pectin methylesterase-like acyl-CoA thioesterase
METLYVFLDNSGSMSGSRLNKAKNYLKSISGRLYESNTNVYFVGSKINSRQIATHHNRINEYNLDSHVLDIWNARDGSTCLWEFI